MSDENKKPEDNAPKGSKEMTPTQRAVLLFGSIAGGFAVMAGMAIRESKRNHHTGNSAKKDQQKPKGPK